MQNDELKKYCQNILAGGNYFPILDTIYKLSNELLQRFEAEEAKTGDADEAFEKWYPNQHCLAFKEDAKKVWLACCDWMKRSTNAPVGVAEATRTVPMTPNEFRDAIRKVVYQNAEHPRIGMELLFFRYQYIMADKAMQMAVSIELDHDLSLATPQPPNSDSPSPSGETK